MRRSKILIHILFLWLLLAAYQHPCFNIKVQATESVGFKLRPAQHGSGLTKTYIRTSRVEEKKARKSPSGPNPIGNHRPPSRP